MQNIKINLLKVLNILVFGLEISRSFALKLRGLEKKKYGYGSIFFLLSYIAVCACSQPPTLPLPDLPISSSAITSMEPGGNRRLALIVGVGDYASDDVKDLVGPPNDARRIYELLTDKDSGYGFPKSDVCLLIDGEATTDMFRSEFNRCLVERADADDVAIVFFAGHGSRTQDINGDEFDAWDETLLLHDARFEGIGDLSDDELHAMLMRLYAKTKRIVVIMDSCNSATATRDSEMVAARFQPPASLAVLGRRGLERAKVKDRGHGWFPNDMPGLVSFSAASDNTSALEIAGSGVFTDALLQVLYLQGDRPVTYAQAARRIRPLVAARSHQVPYFQGDLDTVVFGNVHRKRPMAWEVTGVEGEKLILGGPPQPGIGVGAEMRIYDGASEGSETQDPALSKATVTIDDASSNKITAVSRVIGVRADAPQVLEGDLAILARPSDDFVKLRVRIRPEGEPSGVPKELARRIEEEVTSHSGASVLVEISMTDGIFELSNENSGQLALRSPIRLLRTFDIEREGLAQEVAKNLWLHARQRALLSLRGEGGRDFEDQETLKIEIVPAARQTACAKGPWKPAGVNQEQVVPLCYRWQVKVAVDRQATMPVLVSGLVLSSEGSIMSFPHSGQPATTKRVPEWYLKIEPGEEHLFGTVFEGRPPLGIRDTVMVFGTQETNPVAWHLLAQSARDRSLSETLDSRLSQELDRHLRPDFRGQTSIDESEGVTWTLTSIPLLVEANNLVEAEEHSEGFLASRDMKDVCNPNRGCAGNRSGQRP